MPPSFRADHIGSFLRPTELLNARSSISSSAFVYDDQATNVELKNIEASAISAIVKEQRSRSIYPITDGEYSRHMFYSGFFEKLDGFQVERNLPVPEAFRSGFPVTAKLAESFGVTTRAGTICTAPIAHRQVAYLDEWKKLRNCLSESEWRLAKLTIPSPTLQHLQLKASTAYTPSSGYAKDEEYFADIARAYSSEIHALYEAGVRNIQIDDPNLACFCSEDFRDGFHKDGLDPEQMLDLYVEAHAQCILNRPSDLHVGLHICRGNFIRGTSFVSGSFEAIANKVLNRTGYDTFYLEFDDAQSAKDFEPLRFLPRGKNAVLGLVSTKSREMESPTTVKMRIREAAKVVAKAQNVGEEEALDALAVSPQCGFSSSSQGGAEGFTLEHMWQKLALVSEVAKDVWN